MKYVQSSKFREIYSKIHEMLKSIYQDECNYLRDQIPVREGAKLITFLNEYKPYIDQYSDEERYILYNAFGNSYRIVNQAGEAVDYLLKAFQLAEKENDPRKMVITLIRKGEAFKYNNHHQEALILFEKALTIIRNATIYDYEDFLYQHKGKCLMELHRWDEAETSLQKALDIRVKKQDPDLIASTKKAILFVKDLRSETNWE